MLWSGKGETLGLSDFAAVEKHWESQEKGIIQRLSHSRVFRPVTMFVIALLLSMFLPGVSRAANIRIIGEEVLENAIGTLEREGLHGFATFLDDQPDDETLPGGEISMYMTDTGPANALDLHAFLENNRDCGVMVLRESGSPFLEDTIQTLHVDGDDVLDFRLAVTEITTHSFLLIGRGNACLFKPGDMNDDGELDLPDALLLADYLFTQEWGTTPPCETADGDPHPALYDLNGDDAVDLSDVIHGLVWRFLGGAPPVPGLDCLPVLECESHAAACGTDE